MLQISIKSALISRRCGELTDMISFLMILWVLSMASTAEAANSTSSLQATTTSEETTLDWVKITVVPLGVFLIGACVWGIIADTTARWRSSFNVPPEAEEVPAHRHINDDSNARDLEEGLESLDRSTDADLALAPISPVDGMMQPELELISSTVAKLNFNITPDVEPQPESLVGF